MTLPETTGDFIFQASVFRGELANALTSTNLYTNAWQKGEFLETSDFPWRNSQHFATLQSPPGSSSHRLPDTWSNVSEKILQGRAPRSHHFTRNEEAPTSREGRVSSILEARMHRRCVVINMLINQTLTWSSSQSFVEWALSILKLVSIFISFLYGPSTGSSPSETNMALPPRSLCRWRQCIACRPQSWMDAI